MFIARETVEKLENENKSLKAEYWELKQRAKLFEDAFFNGLDGLIEKFYKPEPSEVNALFQLESDSENNGIDNFLGQTILRYQETYNGPVVPEEIEEILKQIDTSFSDRLMEIIREKKLDEVEVYKKADLDRRHFSKIRSNSEYRPTKDTVILLCMSMELSFDETVDLLKRAGFAFSNSSKTDLIAQFFIRKKLYNIQFYKEVLFKYGVLKE